MSKGLQPRGPVSELPPTSIWKKIIKRVADDEEPEVEFKGLVRLLSVGAQRGEIVVWYEANPKANTITIQFQTRGTGHNMYGNEGAFFGTCQLSRDKVVHVYYKF